LARAGHSDRNCPWLISLLAGLGVAQAVAEVALSEASDRRALGMQRVTVAAWRPSRCSASHRQTIWMEGAGSTDRVAQRLSSVFAYKTDRLIAEARHEFFRRRTS